MNVKKSGEIFEEFSRFNDDSVMLAFRGEVSGTLLDSLLEIAEKRLHHLGCEKPTRKKAFNILVECLQNLFVHGNEDILEEEPSGVIIMMASDDGISIATGNSIHKNAAEMLKSRLERLEALPKELIREEYKEQLVNGKFSNVGGAGLGFLDIARKSGRQMEYQFSPIDDERLFFTFNVKVS